MRDGAFPDPDQPVDDGGVAKARALAIRPTPDRVMCSPALAAQETVQALGLIAQVEPVLADMDWGRWRGAALTDLQATESEALMAWLRDPSLGAPGGETFAVLKERVAAWMQEVAVGEGRILAITHTTVMRAALAQALDIPAEAAFRIDIAPLMTVTLSFNRVWRLQGLGDA